MNKATGWVLLRALRGGSGMGSCGFTGRLSVGGVMCVGEGRHRGVDTRRGEDVGGGGRCERRGECCNLVQSVSNMNYSIVELFGR